MEFCQVVLDIPTSSLEGAFDYRIPEGMKSQVEVGTTVLQEFSHRMQVGYVVGVSDRPSSDLPQEKIKSIQAVLAPSAFDVGLVRLARWMSVTYAAPLCDCLRLMIAPGQSLKAVRNPEDGSWSLEGRQAKGRDDLWVMVTSQGRNFQASKRASRQRQVLAALGQGAMPLYELRALVPGAAGAVSALERKGVVRKVPRRSIRGGDQMETTLSSANAARPHPLTAEQREAMDAIDSPLRSGTSACILVDGVTGSGKTEVYLQAIQAVLEKGKGAIVLVPEISLTAQTVGRFRSRFGDQVAILHSRLSQGERFDQWDMVRQGKARVVVGARSALFAPLYDLGLIVIDEEHETSYKQDQSPRYHSRDVALELARIRSCPLVLGSATPSLEALKHAHDGQWQGIPWKQVRMEERPGISRLPEIQVVNMEHEFSSGRKGFFSRALQDALLEVVERREKAVLLLNRRGFANFLMCRECGCVPECPHCATSLTYHERTHSLVCHSCNRSWSTLAYPNPHARCPNCNSPYLAQYGVGTQQVEDQLEALVGNRAEIVRMDWDSTRGKGQHQKLLERFDSADCAILIGTQMVAKGLDFPEVTLVGVINADTTLKLPDFRAAEKTYDLLEQVAGRAGRGQRPGKVIIQTYWSTHPALVAVATHNRNRFLATELQARREAFYPPYARLANVIFWGKDQRRTHSYASRFAQALRALISGTGRKAPAVRPPSASESSRLPETGQTSLDFDQVMTETSHLSPLEQLDAMAEALSRQAGPEVVGTGAEDGLKPPSALEAETCGAARQGWEVLGPAECVKSRVQDRYRYHILVKAPELERDLGPMLKAVRDQLGVDPQVRCAIDVDACDMM